MISRKHLERVKKNCIVCNMGHSNQEIDLDSLKDLKREKIRKNVTHLTMPNGKTVVLLADVCVYRRGAGGTVRESSLYRRAKKQLHTLAQELQVTQKCSRVTALHLLQLANSACAPLEFECDHVLASILYVQNAEVDFYLAPLGQPWAVPDAH